MSQNNSKPKGQNGKGTSAQSNKENAAQGKTQQVETKNKTTTPNESNGKGERSQDKTPKQKGSQNDGNNLPSNKNAGGHN